MQRIFTYPSRNLHVAIPIVMILGAITGIALDTESTKNMIRPLTFIMIVSAMIGFPWKALFSNQGNRLLSVSLGINFIIIPFFAWFIIRVFAFSPEIVIGFAILASLPSSSMSIVWTMLAKGNVSAAVRMSTVGLLLGAVLLPVYLFLMVGQTINIPLADVFISIVIIVIIPLLLSQVIQKGINIINSKDKDIVLISYYLPNINSWILVIVIFLNISLQVEGLTYFKNEIYSLVFAFVCFYVLTFTFSTVIAKRWFSKEDGIALVYGTSIRHLSISLGIAITAFGGITVFVITFAYIFQAQAAAWYGKLANDYIWNTDDKKQ